MYWSRLWLEPIHKSHVILEKRADIYAVFDANWIFRLLKELPKLVSVITQQTVVETKPEESLIVLYHSIHDGRGPALFQARCARTGCLLR